MPDASFTVRVTPRASRNEVVCGSDGALLVKTTAPPADGAANKAVTKLLADALLIPKSSLRLKSGETSRNKVFVIEGVGDEELQRRIRKVCPAGKNTQG